MEESPKCYRCGRESSQQLSSGDYWCSWCGQTFDLKDEGRYKEEETKRKEEESKALERPTFTCERCGRIVQPMYRHEDKYLFRGWRCTSCGRMLCDSCHSPTLGQPCECGSVRFESIELSVFSSGGQTNSRRLQHQSEQVPKKKWWQFWKS